LTNIQDPDDLPSLAPLHDAADIDSGSDATHSDPSELPSPFIVPPTTADAEHPHIAEKMKAQARWSTQEPPGHKTAHHRRFSILSFPRSHPDSSVPLDAVLLTLPPTLLAFFTYLDKQLEKINSFYLEREKEVQARSKLLHIQLRELKDHREILYVSRIIPQI